MGAPRNKRVIQKKKRKTAKRGAASTVESDNTTASSSAVGSKRTTSVTGGFGKKVNKKLKFAVRTAHSANHQSSSQRRRELMLSEAKSERSAMLHRHAKERMVLKEHIRNLTLQRARLKKGETAKKDRRDLGHYIRNLQAMQAAKHAQEKADAEQAVNNAEGAENEKNAENQPTRGPFSGSSSARAKPNQRPSATSALEEEDGEEVGQTSSELRAMFAHLTV